MDRELLTESFIRDATKQAAIKESERLMKEMEEETVFVPPGFHDKILKLLKQGNNAHPLNRNRFPWKTWSGLAASFFIGMLAITVLLMTIPAFGDWMNRIVGTPDRDFMRYSIENKQTVSGKASDFKITYIPQGFQLSESLFEENFAFFEYRDAWDNFIRIHFNSTNAVVKIDNEDLEKKETVIVNSQPAEYTYKMEVSTIIWTQNNMLVLVSTSLDQEETVKIAEGIANK